MAHAQQHCAAHQLIHQVPGQGVHYSPGRPNFVRVRSMLDALGDSITVLHSTDMIS